MIHSSLFSSYLNNKCSIYLRFYLISLTERGFFVQDSCVWVQAFSFFEYFTTLNQQELRIESSGSPILWGLNLGDPSNSLDHQR